jgi:hypothetical protein
VWLGKAGAAGFVDIGILSRRVMGEDRLPLYPVYREGGLDALFARVAPEERWRLVESATIGAVKPHRQRRGPPVPTVDGACSL